METIEYRCPAARWIRVSNRLPQCGRILRIARGLAGSRKESREPSPVDRAFVTRLAVGRQVDRQEYGIMQPPAGKRAEIVHAYRSSARIRPAGAEVDPDATRTPGCLCCI